MTGIADLFEEGEIRPVTLNGTTMHVRELGGLAIYEAYEKAEKSGTGLVKQLLLRSICDEKGRPLVANVKELEKIPRRWIDALFDASGHLNGIGVTEKNSEAGQSSASS